MTTYAFPTSLTPSTSAWELVTNTRDIVSPLTGAVQSVARKGSRWKITLAFNNLSGEDRSVLQGFLVQLNGSEHRFTVSDHSKITRGGAGGGTPVVDGASQTGNSINVSGATASVTNWLKAGDWLSIGSQLFMCTENTSSNGSGLVTVKVQPGIRTSPADDAAEDIALPVSGTFMLIKDAQWSNRPGVFSNITIEAIEDITL